MFKLPKALIEQIGKEYPRGTRIMLTSMPEACRPELGVHGTVQGVDEEGRLIVNWDNRSRLCVVCCEDEFEVVSRPDEKPSYGFDKVEEAVNLLRKAASLGILTRNSEGHLMVAVAYDDGTTGWNARSELEAAIDLSKQPDAIWEELKKRIREAEEIETTYEISFIYDGTFYSREFKSTDAERTIVMLKNSWAFDERKEYRILSVKEKVS